MIAQCATDIVDGNAPGEAGDGGGQPSQPFTIMLAVAAGLAGIRFGLAGIPDHWLLALRGFALVAPLISSLLARTTEVNGNRE